MKKDNKIKSIKSDMEFADCNIDDNISDVENVCVDIVEKKSPFKNSKFLSAIRPAVMCLIILTLICGVLYPVSVTIIGQSLFPYEANGSQITVNLADGTQKIFGSELIGQSYEDPKYLFGRVNTGSPTNLSPESDEYKKLLQERIIERQRKLAAIGYTDEKIIPDELITSSGSGVDPHISPETAYIQIPIIVATRTLAGEEITEVQVREIIDKYTEGRFLGIFGAEKVNVLLVNLALDGLV